MADSDFTRRTPLGIIRLNRKQFDHLARMGRIMVCRSGTPYCDTSEPGDPPRWEVCQIEPECFCRHHQHLVELHALCPCHGGES